MARRFPLSLIKQALLGLGLEVALAGCIFGPLSTPTPVPVLADCFVNFHLSAWVDADGDGNRDEGEAPLQGVEFFVNGPYASSVAGGKGTSDENGEASIDTWSPGGCLENAEFSVLAETPEGYELTTISPIVHDGSTGLNGDYAFGFAPIDGTP
ncbi:MAG: hypothetical protein DWQ07_21740 [Chloroflexi bacterium]|nr:MAG: hypothetical protein DWQ07_21740 [Chloroflexota bacterium]MBL1197326.1 hypothetical protein [Chloroflexota bacterium]NOH14622.1 hypothetical protein [Chloroflexota bacterium]